MRKLKENSGIVMLVYTFVVLLVVGTSYTVMELYLSCYCRKCDGNIVVVAVLD